MFECADLKYMVSGQSTNKHIHADVQYSYASVELAQAHPNYFNSYSILALPAKLSLLFCIIMLLI